MKLLFADCSVVYVGRGNTMLDRALRTIIIKDDGAISIHNDIGNKPLNYMGAKNIFTKTVNNSNCEIWRFETRKEYIEITIYSVIDSIEHKVDNGQVILQRDGTEDNLQEFLFNHPSFIDENFVSLEREYSTSAGNIDLLFEDVSTGFLVGVEVKRVAMIGAVDQCSRYLEALRESYDNVSVMLAALDVRPNTAKLADKRRIPYKIIDASWITHYHQSKTSILDTGNYSHSAPDNIINDKISYPDPLF